VAVWPRTGGPRGTRSGRARPASPGAIASSSAGTIAVFAAAWVAIAPTPARAHGTTAPTPRNFDWTATARSPVAGSRATIEKVIRSASVLDPRVEHGREDVDEQVGEDDEQGREEDRAHDQRHVGRPDRVHGELAHTRPAEDLLDDDDAAEEEPEVQPDLGEDRPDGVPEGVPAGH